MATLEEFRAWYDRDLGRFAPWKRHVQVMDSDQPEGSPVRELRIHIFSDKNRYTIHVREPKLQKTPVDPPKDDSGQPAVQWNSDTTPWEWKMDRGYLGCISSSRRWRPGEDWHRGSDLLDGPFDERMWHSIVADMLAYELVEIVQEARGKQQQPIIDGYLSTPVPLTDPHIFGGRPML